MAETVESLSVKLSKAQAAFEKLLCGEQVAEWQDSNGERVRYTQANRGALSAYIFDLEHKISVLAGVHAPVKPMRVFF